MKFTSSERREFWLRWWYRSISAGFVALAFRAWLEEEKWWLVAIRVVIAVGFVLLSLLPTGPRRS